MIKNEKKNLQELKLKKHQYIRIKIRKKNYRTKKWKNVKLRKLKTILKFYIFLRSCLVQLEDFLKMYTNYKSLLLDALLSLSCLCFFLYKYTTWKVIFLFTWLSVLDTFSLFSLSFHLLICISHIHFTDYF